jgi:hypothetical protein
MINSTSTRRSVAHQLKPRRNASSEVRHCELLPVNCFRAGRNFCTSSRRPDKRAARAADRARARRCRWRSAAGTSTPIGLARSADRSGRQQDNAGQRTMQRLTVGRRDAACHHAAPTEASPAHRNKNMPPAGALRPRDGPRGRRRVAVRGGWRQSHPVPRRPGQAEQTTARGASVRSNVKVRLTWRPARRPAPQGRVDGERDGDMNAVCWRSVQPA